MNVLAYCTYTAREAVRKATGVEPLTSPPYDFANLPTHIFDGRDLIYFRLHGLPLARGAWYGDGPGSMPPALTAHTIRNMDLTGAVVVVANCYGADDPLVMALYNAGAGAVIAGPGRNYASGEAVIGADLLVRWLIVGLRLGLNPGRALQLARMRLRLTSHRRADKDALEFDFIRTMKT